MPMLALISDDIIWEPLWSPKSHEVPSWVHIPTVPVLPPFNCCRWLPACLSASAHHPDSDGETSLYANENDGMREGEADPLIWSHQAPGAGMPRGGKDARPYFPQQATHWEEVDLGPGSSQ